jgi:DNA repair protein RecN (Recombination protein N)
VPGEGAAALQTLAVRDLALIHRLEVRFGPGLNVLTGETGAGKSLLLDALALALGARARAELVRQGADAAVVDAQFAVAPDGPAAVAAAAAGAPPPEDGVLLLQREVGRDGRSVSRLNGRLCTAAQLRAVGEALVDVHGQGEQQRLLHPASQAELLDLYAGGEAAALLGEVAAGRRRLEAVEAELAALQGDPRARERQRDLLAFARAEIDAAGLRPGEDEDLAARRNLLQHAERLHAAAAAAYEELYGADGAVADRLGRVVRTLGDLVHADPRLQAMLEPLTSAMVEVEETARSLRRYRDELSFEPGELARVEERWELVQRLRRKYGETVAEILAYRDRAAAELDRWEEAEAEAARLEAARAQQQAALREVCARLSALRAACAARLESDVAAELAALGMAGARLRVRLAPAPVGPRGADHVEFLWSANAGEPERPLQRAASGGELSRAMLALKVVLAAADPVPVLVFDEVDAGIGGRAAQAVAERLAALAGRHQVFCVTHLATVAALADVHLAVRKAEHDGRTHVAVERLEGPARREEIARMLSGGGEAARRLAETLLTERRGRPAS